MTTVVERAKSLAIELDDMDPSQCGCVDVDRAVALIEELGGEVERLQSLVDAQSWALERRGGIHELLIQFNGQVQNIVVSRDRMNAAIRLLCGELDRLKAENDLLQQERLDVVRRFGSDDDALADCTLAQFLDEMRTRAAASG